MLVRILVVLCLFLGACAPALKDQLSLEQLSHKATAKCVAAVGGAKKPICTAAKVCVSSIKSAVDAIQLAQEARGKGAADTDLDVTASGLTAGARATCTTGGF